MPSSAEVPETEQDPEDGGGPGADPVRSGTFRPLSVLRWLGVVAVALVGAGIGTTLLGQTSVDTSVGEIELTSRPAIGGGFTMSLAPLGTVELPMSAPVRLQARLVALDNRLLVQAGRDLAQGEAAMSNAEAEKVATESAERIAAATGPLALKTLLGGLLGGALTVALVYRRRREVLVGAATGLLAAVALVGVSFAAVPEDITDAEVTGALGLLPNADPGVTKSAEGLEEYVSKTFRNIEGLYSGYVRSAAADRIATSSDRVIAVTGDPTDDEVRRQVAVLASSQGAEGVVWIIPPEEVGAEEGAGEGATTTGPDAVDPSTSLPDAGTDGPAPEEDAPPSFPELPDGVAVLFVAPDQTAGLEILGRFPVLVLGPDGCAPADGDAAALREAALVVDAGGGSVPDSIERTALSTGDEPAASGARLTTDTGAVRISTGTATTDRLEGVVISFGRNSADVLQAQLVTVPDGEVSMQRVLR